MPKIRSCSVCHHNNIAELIDFGKQPVSHRFLENPGEEENTFNLKLGQCTTCGTVQLTDRIPIEKLKPRYDWITQNEPEVHLDDLAKTISQLHGINKNSHICGLSSKDSSLLLRLRNMGYTKTRQINPQIKKNGPADIFIARHMLEHAYNFHQFVESAKKMVNKEGYIIFEIPDCQYAFEKLDYTVIWEEHTIYFTTETFRNCFAFVGLSLIHFEKVKYPIEDIYIGIARVNKNIQPAILKRELLEKELLRAQTFAYAYHDKMCKFKRFLSNYKQRGRKIALFGAGHRSCTFLNLLNLKDYIEFIVDDNPRFRSLFMPGSRLPILESKDILEKDIQLVILALSLESEEKVIKKNEAFSNSKGKFVSILPGSKYAMEIE